METKRYAVYRSSGPGDRPTPFVCRADSAVEAIGKFEAYLHGRKLPREALDARAYRLLDEGGPDPAEPRRSPAATGEIRPAPFKLRFHVPEARADDARPAYYPLETGSAADAARIRFEVDGRATGELREIPGSDGSHWIVSSLEPNYHAAGSGARFTLWDACRAVERVTEQEHERWLQAPGHETAAPERAVGMER